MNQIDNFFEQECRNFAYEPILVGVSGGPDSICLLDLLIRSKRKVIVAHFNHLLRPGATKEASRIKDLATKLGVPFVSDSQNVKAYSSDQKLSLEEAARILRYRFLFNQAHELGAPVIAVAHHADDQVETVLMHLLRGAGLSGLKGMLPVTFLPQFDIKIRLIRPLLKVWRIEIEQYCLDFGLDPIHDETNQDQTFFRNRLRHGLIPELETYNPGFKKVLLRSIENLAGDLELVNVVVEKAWETLDLKTGKGFIDLDLEGFRMISTGLQRNIIRKVSSILKPEIRDVSFETVERTIQFVMDKELTTRKIDFSSGLIVFIESGRLVFSDSSIKMPVVGFPQFQGASDLLVGEILQLDGEWVLLSEEISSFDIESIRNNDDLFQAWLDADHLKGYLHIRGRSEGDRFQPLGMPVGSLKVSDIFINLKIPSRARKYWPLVCLENDIIWIPGCRSAHRFRVTNETKKLIHLTAKRMR